MDRSELIDFIIKNIEPETPQLFFAIDGEANQQITQYIAQNSHGHHPHTELRFLSEASSPEEIAEKKQWLASINLSNGNLGDALITCSNQDVNLLASPKSILVDTSRANIAAWEQEGGFGVHHNGDTKETADKLHKALQRTNARKLSDLPQEELEAVIEKITFADRAIDAGREPRGR